MKETDDETVRDHFKMQMFEYNLTHEYIHPLLDYIMDGIQPAGFLRAVIMNDLVQSIQNDVDVNVFRKWCRFLQWEMPSDSWGNYAFFTYWCGKGGLRGIAKQEQKGILDVASELSSVGSNEGRDQLPVESSAVDKEF